MDITRDITFLTQTELKGVFLGGGGTVVCLFVFSSFCLLSGYSK